MLVVRSRNGVPVRLTEERWGHLTRRHPEMAGQRARVLEAVSDPDVVQEGDAGEFLAVRRYAESPLTEKFLVVAYRELGRDDGYILTAYLTNRPSARRVTVWKR